MKNTIFYSSFILFLVALLGFAFWMIECDWMTIPFGMVAVVLLLIMYKSR